MFARLDHGTRIFVLAGVIALLVLLDGVFAIIWTTRIKSEFSEVARRDLPLWGMTARLIDRRLDEALLFDQAWAAAEADAPGRLRLTADRRREAFLEAGEKLRVELNAEAEFARQTLAAGPPVHPERAGGQLERLLLEFAEQHDRYLDRAREALQRRRDGAADAPEAQQAAERSERLMTETLIALQRQVDRFTASSARDLRRAETGLQHGLATFTLTAFLIGVFMLRAIKRVNDDRRAAMRELQAIAVRDPLTGVANRRRFETKLHEAVHAARRYGDPLSLCLVDLDRFKQVNDEHGHAAGDEALRRFAARASRELRDLDLLGRLGGDEFAILFWHTAARDAEAVVERIREGFAREGFETAGGGRFQLSATFGLADLTPDHADAAALLAAADRALYQAKARGRNCTVAARGAGAPRATPATDGALP